MSGNKISITRALVEVKTLEERINRATSTSVFYAASVKGKIVGGSAKNQTDADFEKEAKSAVQSIFDMIKRRSDLKREIAISNASTKVSIAGEEMTVQEAIERKNSIHFYKDLLHTLESQYRSVSAVANSRNERAENSAKEILSSKAELTEDVIVTVRKQMVDEQLTTVVGQKMDIEKLSSDITDFLSEVDFALSESNAITHIEV